MPAADPLNTAIAQVTAIDPEVQKAVRKLVLDAVAVAQEMMDYGAAPIKMQLVKSLMPAMVKEMAKQKEDDGELAAMREEMRGVMAEVRGGGPVASEEEDPDLHGGATDDNPGDGVIHTVYPVPVESTGPYGPPS